MPPGAQRPLLSVPNKDHEPDLARMNKGLPVRIVAVAVIITMCMMVAVCIGLLLETKTRTLQVAERDEGMFVGLLANRLDYDIESLSLSIQQTARSAQLSGISDISPDLQQAALFDESLHIKSLGSLGIVDKDGNLKQESSTLHSPAINISGSEFLDYHRTHADAGVYFSGPTKSLLSGQQVIILSKRLNDARGGFAGAVVGTLYVSYYERMLRQIDRPVGSALGIVLKNGQIVIRVPFDPRAASSNMLQSEIFKQIERSPSGSFIEKSPIDQTQHLATYQVVGDSPFIVYYGRDTREVFANWTHWAVAAGGTVILLCAFTAVFIWQLHRERLRRESAEHHARLSAQVLATVNKDLERRIHDEVQAREEANEKLMASRRLEALGQLAGGIAHDMNNVLQAISGACSILQVRFDGNESVTGLANTALSAAQRGSAITRRLLVFARRAPIQSEAIDIGVILTDLQEVLNHTLFSSVVVELDLPPDLPRIYADRMQLETVIINLATNARDAMPCGGDITIAARADTVNPDRSHRLGLAPGQYVRLSIVDTGTGMDATILKRAVEPFFTTKGPSHGTGLGLSMAKAFAEQSKGQLDIVSQPGEGTTVSLWFPVLAAALKPNEPRLPAVTRAPIQRDPSGSRILIVDENGPARELVAELLQSTGFNVVQADSGKAALSLIEAGEKVDLLLTDLSMREMDGVQLIQQVRRNRPDIPAIVLTGNFGAVANLTIEQVVGGTCLILQKPVRVNDLRDNIDIVVAGQYKPLIAALIGLEGIFTTA